MKKGAKTSKKKPGVTTLSRPKKATQELIPYSLLFLGLFVVLSLFSFQEGEASTNWFGRIGYLSSYGLLAAFGKTAFVIGFSLILLGAISLKSNFNFMIGRGLPIFIFNSTVAFHNYYFDFEDFGKRGGLIGQFLNWILEYLFGETGRNLVVGLSFAFVFLYWTKDFWFQGNFRGIDSIVSDLLKKVPVVQESSIKTVAWWERKSENLPIENEEEVFLASESVKSELADISRIKRKYSGAALIHGYFENENSFRIREPKMIPTDKRIFSHIQIIDGRKAKFEVDLNSPPAYVSNWEVEQEERWKELEKSRWEEPRQDIPSPITNFSNLDEEEDEGYIEEESEVEISSLEQEEDFEEFSNEEEHEEEESKISSSLVAFPSPKSSNEESNQSSMVPKVNLKKGIYYISSKLLRDHKKPSSVTAFWEAEAESVSRKIEEVTRTFGVEARVIGKERGPIITRYEVTIPFGQKVAKVANLHEELLYHLAVKSIRIVSPIPGKASIGIEVPNKNREDVFLSEILKETLLQSKPKDLTIAMGKDISGNIVLTDLARLPHLLVAGTTGSGKSVCLNSMITSLICTRSPEDVRMIMIDPKMVEMSLYEDIPHLLMPVITDPKRATKALAWAIQEMEARYQMVSKLKSRDFKSYNEKVEEFGYKKGFEKFPYIVIFIDELADLMMVSGKELEDQIMRISQKSRAVGIHLVLATQRPSVDVITGTIKANCPARVAFQVPQKTDSRTILDSGGAETLLGKGDFLYKSPTSGDLARIQAPFIEEKEIESIVEEAKRQGVPTYVSMDWEESELPGGEGEIDEDLFQKALQIVMTERKTSTTYIQRRLRIGYNRAADLMETMEKRGYVSPPQLGSKVREILRSA